MGSLPPTAPPLESLHPSLWRAHQLARGGAAGVASGFGALDAQLPGGGWPKRALTELMLPQAGIGELRLLAPALVGVQGMGPAGPAGVAAAAGSAATALADTRRPVMLFDPPARLCAQALAALGFDLDLLLVVHTRTPALPAGDSLWAMEQALKSGHVGAVVAWLPPRLSAERLRRLQLACAAHDGPAFALREWAAQHRPSASPLRLALQPAGADRLTVRLLKRRGPPLAQPLRLELPPVLSPLAARRAAQPRFAPGVGVDAGAGTPARAGRPGGGLASATFVNLAP